MMETDLLALFLESPQLQTLLQALQPFVRQVCQTRHRLLQLPVQVTHLLQGVSATPAVTQVCRYSIMYIQQVTEHEFVSRFGLVVRR